MKRVRKWGGGKDRARERERVREGNEGGEGKVGHGRMGGGGMRGR